MMLKGKVVCFGEVLWDVLPEERKPGGAPMNVAYHLNRLGVKSTLISRLGRDLYGREMVDFLQDKAFDTEFIQWDEHYPTSEVLARIGQDNEVSYEIVAPVAWDYIQYEGRLSELMDDADMLVFGSLAARNERSRDTLYRLIEQARFCFFDVNFREPHYSRETVEYLLSKSDAVKLNHHELALIAGWNDERSRQGNDAVRLLQERYGIKEMIVTRGDKGASYYTMLDRYDYGAYSVRVQDTIGSGDSFLAAFISQKLAGKSIEEALDYAAALGAFVTSQAGANPPYQKYDLTRFIWKKKLI